MKADLTLSKVIAYRLREALKENEMTQKELSDKLGFNKSNVNTISYWLKTENRTENTRLPNIQQIVEIAKILNVSTDYLLGLTEIKSQDIETKAICEKTHLSENAVEGLQNRNGKAVLFELIELLATSKEEDTVSKFLQAIKDRYAFYAQKENSAIAQEFYKLSELHISRYAFDLANEIVDSLVKKPSTKA